MTDKRSVQKAINNLKKVEGNHWPCHVPEFRDERFIRLLYLRFRFHLS